VRYLGRMAEPVTQNRYIYVHNNPLLFVDPLGNNASDYVDGINSVGTGFVDYLGYTASLSGLHGEQRQNEVLGFLRTYGRIMDQIASNPRVAYDAAVNAINEVYQDNPDFIRGRSLVGPAITGLVKPISGNASASTLITLGMLGMAANGDTLRAIEYGANSLDEFVQAALLGAPLGGQCTAAF